MRAEDFIDAVVPAGIRYAAWTDGKKYGGLPAFKHKPFRSSAALRDFLEEKDAELNGTDENVYYALASFINERIEKRDKKNGNTYRACSRSHDNVQSLRSFWIDVDCKDEGYASQADALRAIAPVVQKGSLPRPTFVVSSGNGLHFYWCVDEDLSLPEWQPLADGLRDRCLQLQIRFDTAVTVDGARVLRLPGTHNRKDAAAPKPVAILKVGPVWSRPNLEPYLAAVPGIPVPGRPARAAPGAGAAHLPGTAAKAFGAGSAANAPLSAGIATRRNIPSLAPVVTQCRQLALMAADGGAGVPEPLWMATLHLAAYADDGRVWAHRLSDGHADYSADETEAKFDARLDAKDKAGPTLCATFHQHRPDGCAGCPHAGLIRSPIALKDEGLCLPHLYTATQDGVVMADPGDYNGPGETRTISPMRLHGGKVFFRDDVGYVLRARLKRLPTDRRAVDVDAEARHLVSGASKAFAHMEAVFGLQPGMEKHMVNFTRSWIEELRRRRGAADAYTTLGWTQDMDAFVFGDDVVSQTTPPAGFVVDVDRSFSEPYVEAGSLDNWKAAAAHIAGCADVSPELSVMLAVSFGAPLMALTPEQGLVMTFQSATSGVGKTKAMTTAAAVWGDPELVMFKHNDTPLSVERRLGVAKSFPGLWDEVRPSQKEAAAFRSLVYHISGGRERSRLRSDATAQTVGRWKTLLAMATNYDLLEIVADGDENGSPATARMLPFVLRNAPHHDAAADRAFAKLASNYGVAGKHYMAYVLTNRSKLEAMLDKVAEALRSAAGGAETESRFIVSGCAAVLVGAAAARAAGLVGFDLPAIRQCLTAAITGAAERQRREKAQAAGTAGGTVGALMAILAETRDYWVVTDAAGKLIRRPVFAGKEPLWHVDLAAGEATIRARTMRTEMGRRRLPQSALGSAITAGGVRLTTRQFGAGTCYVYPAEPCYVFDLAASGLGPIVDASINS